MIDPVDISVVVQGPITGRPDDPVAKRLTYQTLESVHRHLPGCEIIVSTWRGSNTHDLPPFHRLVESDDPGGWPCDLPPGTVVTSSAPRLLYNANRQIVSSLAGLQAATRPYAMKLRSDMVLTGTGFIDWFGRYRARCPERRILRERVLACTIYSRNPRKKYNYPFHPSDWFHFGLREDVLNLWDIPLAPEPETSRWLDSRPRPENDPEQWPTYRYTVEQYNWLTFLRKHGDLVFDYKTDDRPSIVALSELTLANNLVFGEPTQFNIKFMKYPITADAWLTVYTHGDWLRLYRRYCDPTVRYGPDLVVWHKRASAAQRFFLNYWWQLDLGPRLRRVSPLAFRVAKRLHTMIFSSDNPLRG